MGHILVKLNIVAIFLKTLRADRKYYESQAPLFAW
jgi:hypothetical protein